jgi:hypothetical protein
MIENPNYKPEENIEELEEQEQIEIVEWMFKQEV